jgi:undecaprenyl-diphosphatase
VNILQAAVLGIVEGVTEFLPVSSTGHLTIVEKLLGLQVDDPGVTAFTAVIQVGAIVAVVVFFRQDIVRLVVAWFRGIRDPRARQAFDYRFAWYVIAGSVPIGVVGLAARDLVSGPLRSLWVVAAALIGWSAVMVWAERAGRQDRREGDLRLRDVMVVGAVQCLALVPGVSRSGATISAGLLRGLDRVTATRLSFFLSIPALTAAGALEAVGQASAISATVGWVPTLVGTLVSLVVAYATIAWLLRLVAHHPITVFVGYRVLLGVALVVVLATGVLTAT